jgi:hypothetical protein
MNSDTTTQPRALSVAQTQDALAQPFHLALA